MPNMVELEAQRTAARQRLRDAEDVWGQEGVNRRNAIRVEIARINEAISAQRLSAQREERLAFERQFARLTLEGLRNIEAELTRRLEAIPYGAGRGDERGQLNRQRTWVRNEIARRELPPPGPDVEQEAWDEEIADPEVLGQPPAPLPKKPIIEDEMPEFKRAELAGQLLVGCDPEFVVLKDGVAQDVHRIIPHDGTLGFDHSGFVIEFRPHPSKSAWGLTRKIASLMSCQRAKLLESFRWRAGACYSSPPPGRSQLTLGGHIHFGHEKYLASPFQNYKNCVGTLAELTRTLEKVDILPSAESFNRRTLSQYGQLTDVRGGDDNQNHWEYRAMASWLYHPDTAFLCLTLGKLAVLHPKTIKQILVDHKANPSAAVRYCLERFKRDVDSRRALEMLPLDSPKKLVHDPEAEIREAWKVEIAEAVEGVKEVATE